jgi:hypothetical protein
VSETARKVWDDIKLNTDNPGVLFIIDAANAAIAELEAENERLKLEVESVRDEFCGDCEYLPRGWHS